MKTKALIVDRLYKHSKADFDKATDIEFVSVNKMELTVCIKTKHKSDYKQDIDWEKVIAGSGIRVA